MQFESVDIDHGGIERISIPMTLLSQFLPQHYPLVRSGALAAKPERLIEASIRKVLQEYAYAVLPAQRR